MRFLKLGLLLLAVLGVSACSSKFYTYRGPEVTQVVVNKGERRLHLLHHDKVLKSYNVGLGFAPQGHKFIEGDGKTPEGNYFIDRRNPNSKFYLSIGISYPNPVDRMTAQELGKSPGGDIFIHGQGPNYRKGSPRDWTAGCIAVTDKQMRDIYAMVQDGTPIQINP
ncbi:L,D-transpeptidase family protein [Sagittula stellata]|uniref:ErfK/YbiS/YcfS/YnhG n=1 Tax=Sagittula stellata (strain ATCC 700073 / DSM 11524 / E-37) TaxID=388399 RepID=A3K2U8_SAGS3|nr:L,D-transpeptidase family protein [Sagittula stellata]EBA08507.1 ErfK/YbiS/YcfS/YnhG [Sagittula stellata E-37]